MCTSQGIPMICTERLSLRYECNLSTEVTNLEMSEGKYLVIGSQLGGESLENFKSVLEKHVGVFAWTYKDLKGIKLELCQHYIDLWE